MRKFFRVIATVHIFFQKLAETVKTINAILNKDKRYLLRVGDMVYVFELGLRRGQYDRYEL